MSLRIKELATESSLFNQYLKEIRDVNIQKDRLRFRKNIERMGSIFAYEISKTWAYKKVPTQTPLGVSEDYVLQEQPVIASVLRAGLPLHQAMLDYFDQADNAFAGAYREEKGALLTTVFSYLASPSLENRALILVDPMLATGGSMLKTYQELLKRGKPKTLHIVSIIASKQAVEKMKLELPEDAYLWLGKIDPELTNKSYIAPGIGDAGDLAFGEKL